MRRRKTRIPQATRPSSLRASFQLHHNIYFDTVLPGRPRRRCGIGHVRANASRLALGQLLRENQPLAAAATMRPFFEAYAIVAEVLRLYSHPVAHTDSKDLSQRAIGCGRQYVAQERVRSSESVSTLLFATAQQVVADQGLL